MTEPNQEKGDKMTYEGIGGAIADMLDAHARKEESDYQDYQAVSEKVRKGNPPAMFRVASTETMWHLHGETRGRCVDPDHKNVHISRSGQGVNHYFCPDCYGRYLGVHGRGFDHYVYTTEAPR